MNIEMSKEINTSKNESIDTIASDRITTYVSNTDQHIFSVLQPNYEKNMAKSVKDLSGI